MLKAFDEFIATRRACEDLRQIADSPYGSNNNEPETYPNPISGFAYDDSFAIQQHAQDNGFTCFLPFEESSLDLLSLELELFYYFGRHNHNADELPMFERVALACLQSDIDRALRYVQDGLGVTSGDYAAQHFSDLAEGEWFNLTRDARLQRLVRYIAEEIGNEVEFRFAEREPLDSPDRESWADAQGEF